MRFQSIILPSFFAAATLLPVAATAQQKQDRNWCTSGAGITAELRVDSCTAVLESGKGSYKQQAVIYKSRGDAYFQRRESDLALRDYTQAIKLNAKYSEAYDGRCWTLATLDKLAEAANDCKASLRLRPNFAPTLTNLGLVDLRLGQFDDAIASYTAALQVDPKSAYALYGRGMAKQKKGDSAGGAADIAASKAIKDVAAEMGGYGVK
jgi:tetratricopeptide (TPR) repeat protein